MIRLEGLPATGALASRLGELSRLGAAPALLVVTVLTSVGLADGGLFPRTWRLATIAMALVAAAALLARTRVVVTRLERWFLAGLSAYAAWIAASATWSAHPATSVVDGERALLYVAAVAAMLLVAERVSFFPLAVAVAAAVTLVCADGLATHVITHPPPDPFELRLLYQPFGYANAVGIFAAVGVLADLGILLRARGAAPRLAVLVSVAVLAPTLYLTHSRGAWLALAAGLLFVAFRLRSRIPPRLTVTLALLAAAGVAAVLVASGGARTPSRIGGDNRVHYWSVAWSDYRAHPLLGSGAGSYGDYWLRHRPIPSFTRTAHSLYLQSLAELGPLGLALVAAALAVPLLALRGRRDPVVTAVAGAYVAYLVHAGIDWDWELPAPTLAGLFCGAAVLVAARRDDAPSLSARARAALLLPALALAALALVRLETGPGLPFGR